MAMSYPVKGLSKNEHIIIFIVEYDAYRMVNYLESHLFQIPFPVYREFDGLRVNEIYQSNESI